MEKRKLWMAVAVCLVLFLGGYLLCAELTQNDTNEWQRTKAGDVVLSEIMASNRTYPTADGELLDFIEVHNLSASTVDISGYMLADDLNSIGYTFPEGSVLPPYGYAVCWCKKDSDSKEFAKFGIARRGGDTIYLYNSANVLVDEKKVEDMEVNASIIRLDEETWEASQHATPGFANTAEGYSQWLQSMGGGNESLVITEVMTDNSCITDGSGHGPTDWVEITNMGTAPADLAGTYLTNDPLEPLKWQLPDVELEAGERMVIFCENNSANAACAPFGLSRSGCTVMLTGILGDIVSQADCPALETDHSWAIQEDGSFAITVYATPGFSNDMDGYHAWEQAVGGEEMEIVISEVMSANRSTVLSAAGALCDWVELTNIGEKTAVLDGAYLSDDPGERGKWRIDSLSIAPGESAVIPLAGNEAAQGEAAFAIAKAGDTVVLSGPAGNILAELACPRLEDDRSYARMEDGSYVQTDRATPGYPNTEEGYLSYCRSRTPIGKLAISEVMPANDRYMIQSDGGFYDWLELVNVSAEVIDLADYAISNDPQQPELFPLPKRTLNPGERAVVICSANDTLVGNYIQAPFTLSAEECWVYVTEISGGFSDYLRVHDVPTGGSMGRGEDGSIGYFAIPTPGNPNGAGMERISRTPEFVTPAGVYDGVEKIEVTLQGEGVLHYTLDGSVPTAQSPVYSEPIVLKNTAVVRAAAEEPGKFFSETVTASYIINENHTLPVLCLAAEPEALLGDAGLCNQPANLDGEIACNLNFFGEEGSFNLDCGVELAGNRALPLSQKSFQVHFRSRYGSKVLGYPLFGEDGVQVFDTLRIQGGKDQAYTFFREELVEELALRLSDSLVTRRSRFCVLYVNGEFWGIRSLKEVCNELQYAQQQKVSEQSVELLEEPVAWGSSLWELANYCGEMDMSLPENYDYVAERVDLQALADWMVLQGYSCSEPGDNLRWLSSTEGDGKWRPVLYDLDGAFFERRGFDGVFSPVGTQAYLRMIRGLMENPEFRQLFLQRLQFGLNGTLTEENVLSVIDEYEALLAPEVARHRARWGEATGSWEADVQRLRSFVSRYDHVGLLLDSLETHIGLTEEERQQYFGEVG